MPWTSSDASRFTKKAKSPKAKRQWSDVADSVLTRTGNEGLAIREANAVANKRQKKHKGMDVEAHSYNWRQRKNLKRGTET